MRLSLIVAMAENRVIGRNNDLPWKIPEDLKHFKALTMGKPIIMGRKTFESIGRPLPGRTNIVITRNDDWDAEGVNIVDTVEAAIDEAAEEGAEEAMIIGGAAIYEQTLDLADRIYLTEVMDEFEGDTFFPDLDEGQWGEVERQGPFETEDGHAFAFVTLDAIKPSFL